MKLGEKQSKTKKKNKNVQMGTEAAEHALLSLFISFSMAAGEQFQVTPQGRASKPIPLLAMPGGPLRGRLP